jgi:hypothetical protein
MKDLELPIVGRSVGGIERELESSVRPVDVGSEELGALVAIGIVVRVRRIRDQMGAPL